MSTASRAARNRAESRPRSATPHDREAAFAIWAPFALALLVYARSVALGFVWDDVNFIVENPLAHSWSGLANALGKGYGWVPGTATGGDSSLYFRPVVVIANTMQYILAHGQPWLFHLANVVTHAGTATLLAALVLALGLGEGAALLAGGLFALHPAYSEAVLWISGRTDLLAAFFGMAALALLAGSGPLWVRRHARWAGPLALGLALASKESAIAIVGAVAVMLYIRRTTPTKEARPSPIGWLVAIALYLALRFTVLAGSSGPALPDRGNFGLRFLQGGALFASYLKQLVLPWPLTTEPPHGTSTASLSLPLALIGLILLAGFALAWVLALRILRTPRETGPAARMTRHAPAALLGLTIFLLGIAPVLQWIPTGEIYGERFLYLPAAGLLLFVCAVIREVLTPNRAYALLLALALPYGALVQRRIPDWKDDASLFTAAIKTAPESSRANANLGSSLMKQGKNAEAYPYLKRAVELDGGKDPAKRAQYGSLLVNMGRVDEGAVELEAAYGAGFRTSTLLKNLGIARTRQGRGADASIVLEEALAQSPRDPALLEAYAMARKKAGAFDQSATLFRQAIELDPTRRSAYLNLISLYGNELPNASEVTSWGERFLARFPSAPEAPQVQAALRALSAGR